MIQMGITRAIRELAKKNTAINNILEDHFMAHKQPKSNKLPLNFFVTYRSVSKICKPYLK